jgi:tRNA threonylcarbamoyladenosine biosynthesis protein TsaB
MLLLGLDTASACVSVAVHDGTRVLARAQAGEQPRHVELLAPLIEQVLAAAGADRGALTAVVCGAGPGPYTGLRVGLATARVFGFALGIPVLGVCSLDAVAAGAVRSGGVSAPGGESVEFLAAIDARRREVYWARYRLAPEALLPVRIGDPQVGVAAQVPVAGVPVAGRGALLYPAELGEPLLPLDPDAGELCQLAAAGDPWVCEPQPLYLRRPDAEVPGARKRVRP